MYYNRRASFWNIMPPVIKNLVIINTIIFIFTMLTGNFMYETFALYYFKSDLFKPYQLITHIFMHGSFFHLLFNMYALILFGVNLERMWGSEKFLFYYMVTGIGAALLHSTALHLEALPYKEAAMAGGASAIYAYSKFLSIPTVGASGAVFGVLLGYGMLFPNNRFFLLFPPIALKAKWLVIIYGVGELILGLSNHGGNIAHFAHLGGMIFGFILITYWRRNNKMYS
ncbi:MAG: rhomboid family intramembrane serine protease [Bacteroidales bacterium]